VFRPLHIARASLICRLVYIQHTSLVITQIALALLIIINNGRSILVIQRYKPKTSNIKTILFNLAKLSTALTAIYKIIFLLIYLFLSSFFKILYTQYNSI
jgi:hypothetical protein